MQKSMETLNKFDSVNELNKLWPLVQKQYMSYLEEKDNKITPTALQERGFKYTHVGISGADKWQGMAIWDNPKKDIILRGNISTAKGGILHLSGHYNLQLETLEELDSLIKLFK